MAALARRPHGGLEQEILACLTFAGRPMTAAQVLTDLGGGLAYTTVMTALGRLHDKHAVTRQQFVRAYVYALPLGGPHASATAHRMMRLLEGGTDRAGVLARFVAALRPEDEQLLADLIAQDQHIPEDGHP